MKRLLLTLVCSFFCLGATNPLSINGTDQVLHPDTMYFPVAKDGYKFWQLHTPFPPTDGSDEHPNLYRSNDGVTWVSTGVTNPLFNVITGHSWTFFSDPDWLYVEEYDKWFMAGAPRISNSPREHVIMFAYSSDGKSWTEYDGVAINGLTAPVILSGSSSCAGGYGDDTNAASWERGVDGCGDTQYPTMIYENGTFTLFYGETVDGNNVGEMGCATFTWNNSTNDIENFARCAGNPILTTSDQPATGSLEAGSGHYDVSIDCDGTYRLLALRMDLSGSEGIMVELTSSDKTNWSNEATKIPKGTGGSWDDFWIYRGNYITDGVGNIQRFSDAGQIIYSAYADSSATRIGIKDIASFDGTDYTGCGSLIGTFLQGANIQ